MITGVACGWPLVRVRRHPDDVGEAQRPSLSPWPGGEGRSLVLLEAPVVMVGADFVAVDRRLRAGELACPCGGDLAPWGHARERNVRGVGGLRPRWAARVRLCVRHVRREL